MKKKGFTLIELLGTVILLGVIALIIFPIANGAIKESKEKAYQVQVNAVLEASRKWGGDNTNLLPEENTDVIYNLNLYELVNSGYIEDSKDIKDPRTNEIMDGCVSIRYSSSYSQYIYEYKDSTYCDSLAPYVAITLNKQKNEKGWLNEDFYALITGSGDTFKYCITINDTCTPNKVINKNALGARSLLIIDETIGKVNDEIIPKKICAQSFRGEESSKVECIDYRLDKTAPILELYQYSNYAYTDPETDISVKKYDSRKNGWHNQPVTLSLKKFDNISGIDSNKTYIIVNGDSTLINENLITYGDSNNDGVVDSKDAVAMSQYIQKWDVEINKETSDLNLDGEIDYIDLMLIGTYIAGWKTFFPGITVTENGKDIAIKIETVDNAGNKVIKTETLSIDTEAPTVPVIKGGGIFDKVQVISIETASNDSLSGMDYYEYKIVDENSNSVDTGITDNKVVITSAYLNHKISYRAVDKAGNKSDWSNYEDVNVNKLEGDFDFYVTSNWLNLSSITCIKGSGECTNYEIKYLRGNQEAEQVVNNGNDITSKKSFYISNNDIYTIVLSSEGEIVKSKNIYLHYTSSSYDNNSFNVNLEGFNSVVTSKVDNGLVNAQLQNNVLKIELSNGNEEEYSIGSSCPENTNYSDGWCEASSSICEGGVDQAADLVGTNICGYSGNDVSANWEWSDIGYVNVGTNEDVSCGECFQAVSPDIKDDNYQYNEYSGDLIDANTAYECVYVGCPGEEYYETVYYYTVGIELNS